MGKPPGYVPSATDLAYIDDLSLPGYPNVFAIGDIAARGTLLDPGRKHRFRPRIRFAGGRLRGLLGDRHAVTIALAPHL